ncbi:uncharacterized protein C8R40DRAFT_1101031 [Lentinula edodes]|uniref:uncharacterized protein n=1 Tax=Lentinula edodes TaxID=5353 RepID=UPI001E8EA8F0|nr:uncharacterized protein C8R40DRAFT_1101031 [Lentinula edodes]KAH7876192.1 hypothetical protein C8R40DRAFT_1101031 [Lentinula edodes]
MVGCGWWVFVPFASTCCPFTICNDHCSSCTNLIDYLSTFPDVHTSLSKILLPFICKTWMFARARVLAGERCPVLKAQCCQLLSSS